MSTKEPLNLETAMNEITTIVSQMEKSELSLEQSLTCFERGITLVKQCQKILSDAEQKVALLTQNQNEEQLIPFTNGQVDKS